MNAAEISKKVDEYETYVETRLKKDLGDIETSLNEKLSQYRDWEDVKQVARTVTEFKAKDRDMLVRFEVGCGVHAQAEVTDYERGYVSIGLGYMLEMDCDEADRYADIRMRQLKREIDHFRKLAVDVKVHIKLVLLAISELQMTLLPSTMQKNLKLA